MEHQKTGVGKNMDLERLNINLGGKPVAGYSGSDAVFDEVGAKVGGRLPDAYIQFIRTVDGGHPEIGCFVLPGDDPDDIFEVNHFYAFSDQRVDNIADAIDGWQSVLGKKTLPIGADGGDNQIYLDLNDAVPSVWLYIHDVDEEEEEPRIKVADSFEEFIASLIADPYDYD
jgi:hypothetical protein